MFERQHTNTYQPQYQIIAQQLHEYRKLNANLKKKIKAKDQQINYLFSCIDQLGKSSPSNIQISLGRSRNHSDITYSKETMTQQKHKEKQNLSSVNVENNIFKDVSYRSIIKPKEDIRLPSLRKNVFAQDPQQYQIPRKIIRVPAQKLIPIKPQDIKKKFEQKYKIANNYQ